MEDGVRCELVKLHTINKKKPTKKLVGRKRQSAEEEGEEHHPITAWGLRDPLGTWELDESLLEMRPFVLAFSTFFCMMAEGTQLVGEFVAFPLVMMFFAARYFTCIYESVPGGYAQEEQDAEIDNGGSGGEKELVNSTPLPLYIPSR
jgi:hypothetical protein